MMTLEQIREEWSRDCSIDDLNLDKASGLSPHLHSKYLNELIQVKLKLTKTVFDLSQLKVKKTKYFRGEMTREELQELGWEQWQYRTLKSDIESLVDADTEIQTIQARVEFLKAMVYFLESVLGEIKTRSFHIKNMIEFQKFRAGA
jgi:hypothetical protein